MAHESDKVRETTNHDGPGRTSDSFASSAPALSASERIAPDKILALRSTRVMTSEGLRAAAVLVHDRKIIKISEWSAVPASAHLRDYADLILLPGLIDTHVHINDAGPMKDTGPDEVTETRQHWEGFACATEAAAAGGVTTLVDMPLNCVPETLSVAALEAKRVAGSTARVDWMSWGGAVGNSGSEGNLPDLPALIEAGVPGFKCFLIDSGIDGFAWVDETQLRKILSLLTSPEYRDRKLPLLTHAELAAPIEIAAALQQEETQTDWRVYSTYLKSRPGDSEIAAIALLIELAEDFDTPIHIVHLSTAQAIPALKKARAAGLKITVETCPHYLWFSSEEIPDGGTEWKCAPPIRDAANRDALWQGLLDGAIDMIATDHSPCPPPLKRKDSGRFDQAWGGIASLGLALPVVWTALLTYPSDPIPLSLQSRVAKVVQWLATGPARLAGLRGRKGALAAGFDADIVVFDPDEKWTVTEQDLRFRHKLSPYLGAHLQGRVIETYLRGERIFVKADRSDPAPANSDTLGKELRWVENGPL